MKAVLEHPELNDRLSRRMFRDSLFCLLLVSLLFSSAEAQVRTLSLPTDTRAASNYQVVALMVEFQPDTSRFTSGDGTFSDAIYDGIIPKIDPLPHNKDYFAAHLSFLENYVESVSNGAANLELRLLDPVIRVSGTMGDYSPTGPDSDSDEELAKLAGLIKEAWTLADQRLDILDFTLQQEDVAFVIFHAGSGRDVELTGTQLDRTPEDLPSIFYGPALIDHLLDGEAINFKGVRIDNTILLPETESRLGSSSITDERFLLELSTNGLVAASFFNFLGVPDLFDTETGNSAIGPFGLMDPFGIFAYNGLFAPEPSAWTKEFLGWTQPEVFWPSSETNISLEAGGNSVRIPLSDSEYFLVENRQRDIDDDGITLSIWKDGQVSNQVFNLDSEGFTPTNVDAFQGGVVIAIDDYDWALPGGKSNDGITRNGGVLIWHIDQNQIDQGLANNRVNVDRGMRGIDLEEADSGQDLGFPPASIFQAAFDRGTPFDYFYEGNPVLAVNQSGTETQLYENTFGPFTYPNSDSNYGAPSFVEISDFSASGPIMSFNLKAVSDERFERLPDFSQGFIDFDQSGEGIALAFSPGRDRTNPALLASFGLIGDSLDQYSASTNSRFVRSMETTEFKALTDKPIVFETFEGSSLINLGIWQGNKVAFAVWIHEQLERDTGPFGFFTIPSIRPEIVVGNLMSPDNTGQRLYLGIQDENGNGYLNIAANGTIFFNKSPLSDLVSLATNGPKVFLAGRSGAVIMEGQEFGESWIYQAEDDDFQIVVGEDSRGFTMSFIDKVDKLLYLLGQEGSVNRVGFDSYEGSFPIMHDVDRDSRLETIFVADSALYAYHTSGALVDGFPKQLPTSSAAQVLIAQDEEIGDVALVTGLNGIIYLVSLEAREEIVGVLALGGESKATPYLDGNHLYALSGGGKLDAWRISGIDSSSWNQLYGNSFNWSFVKNSITESDGNSQGLFTEGEYYNWPNPARKDGTQIRFELQHDAEVQITIIDVAGNIVFEFEAIQARAFEPEDAFWQADVARGVYYAKISAETSDGITEDQLVKIGVVR